MNRAANISSLVLTAILLSYGSPVRGAQPLARVETWIECLQNPTRACEIDEAQTVASSIDDEAMRSVELLRIAATQARFGRIEKARTLLKLIDEKYTIGRIDVLREIAKADSLSGLTDELAAAFDEAVKHLQREAPLRQAELLAVIARKEAEVDSMRAGAIYHQAFRVAQTAITEPVADNPAGVERSRMTEGQRSGKLLSAMAVDRALAGDTSFALTIAMAIKQDEFACARAWLVIAQEQAREGLKSEAAIALEMALKASHASLQTNQAEPGRPAAFDGLSYVKLLADIGQLQRGVGLDDKAAVTFSEALAAVPLTKVNWDDWSVSHALSYVATAEKAAGLDEEAAATRVRAHRAAQSVKTAKQRVWALVDVAGTQVKAGLNREAAGTFDDAIHAADLISDPWNQSLALAHVAASLATMGSLPEASMSFRRAVQVAMSGFRAGVPEGALLGLAQAQMQAGLIEDARATFMAWLNEELLNNDEPTRYRALWPMISEQAVRRLISESDAECRRQILAAAHIIANTRLRAEALREMAELEPVP